MTGKPTRVDRGVQIAFRVAHRLLRATWAIRRPHTRGALVAVWHGGEVLLVRNSYRRQYTFPGGYIRRGETAVHAAARELAEECGIRVSPENIVPVYQAVHEFEFRKDDVTIVEVELAVRPEIRVDHREVVEARFVSPERARTLPLVPHLSEYLAERAAARARGAGA